jgi:poly(rC)-binding protein 2/3/4
VQDALYNATGRLRGNLFGSTQNSVGTSSLSSVRADTSPYGRLRDVPLGGQSSLRTDTSPYVRLRDVPLVGQSSLQADTNPYVRLKDVPLGSQSSLQADISPYGRLRDVPLGGQSSVGISHSLNRHTFSQGIDNFTLSRNYDRPSSPGLWTPPVSLSL